MKVSFMSNKMQGWAKKCIPIIYGIYHGNDKNDIE